MNSLTYNTYLLYTCKKFKTIKHYEKDFIFNLSRRSFLIGCGKDGGGGSASIVGKWNVNKVISTEYLNGNKTGADTATSGSITFDNNGNVTDVEEDGSTNTGTYTYSSSAKSLSVISDGDTIIFNVTNLTANNLHLYQEDTESFGGSTFKETVDEDYSR